MAHRLASNLVRSLLPSSLAAALLLMGASGCDAPGFKTKAGKAKYPSQMAQQPIGTTSTTSAGVDPNGGGAQTPAVFSQSLSVSDLIAKACGIAPRPNPAGQTQPGVSPSFDYDSTALADSDRQMLAEVAKCLTEGALKGKAVTLVGRADARGEPEYNMTLGESRANTVHRYLVDLGVSKARLNVTSRGEMDATGTDEQGWARDRRVDIEL